VRRLFEQKKIRVVALTVHITTLKGNARTLVNLQEKKIQILTHFSRRWARPDARRSGFESFCRSFFFITERKKTYYYKLLHFCLSFN
jgi:hypothetical protein